MFDALLGKSAPDLAVAPLDPGTAKMIQSMQAQTDGSDSEIAGKYNAGVKEAGNQALQKDGNQRASQTGEDAGMSQAIRNQYNQIGGNQIGRVMDSNKLNTPLYRSHAIDMATKAIFAQKQVDTQNNMALMSANNNAEIARANALYGVLSGTGAVAGAYVGSHMRSSRSGGVNGFQSPEMGSAYNMNNYGGPNTLGGNDYASRLGR